MNGASQFSAGPDRPCRLGSMETRLAGALIERTMPAFWLAGRRCGSLVHARIKPSARIALTNSPQADVAGECAALKSVADALFVNPAAWDIT